MSEFFLRVIELPLLVYSFFEFGHIEQDEIGKPLLIKRQETEWIKWFCSFLLIPSILEYSHMRAFIRQGEFIREGCLMQF